MVIKVINFEGEAWYLSRLIFKDTGFRSMPSIDKAMRFKTEEECRATIARLKQRTAYKKFVGAGKAYSFEIVNA